MSLDFPWEMFAQAQQQKNQNQQNMYQNINGIGQGIGLIGDAVKQQRQKALMSQIVAAMNQQGAPQQGPQMPGVGGGAPLPPIQGPSGYAPPGSPHAIPAGQTPPNQSAIVGLGGTPQDNTKLIHSLMFQAFPEIAAKAQFEQMDPYKQALTAQANAEAQAKLRPPRQQPEFIPTGESPTGTRLNMDKFSGKVTDTGVKVAPSRSEGLDFRETLRQDRLAKEYRDRVQRVVGARTGGLGLQDQKVDQAIHLRSMVNQSWNPTTRTYELPEMQQGELVMGLANLLSGNNISNIEQLRSITPKTAQGDTAHLISYWTGKPVTYQPQEMIKNLVTSIDRQGQVSEKLRDKYVNGLKNLVPRGLDPDAADEIRHTELTSSFSDVLKESPDLMGGGGGLSPQEQAELAGLEKKYGGH